MDKNTTILAIIAIVTVVLMINYLGFNLQGQVVVQNSGCRVQRYFGECYELGKNWEKDPYNPGWCRNCGYVGYE